MKVNAPILVANAFAAPIQHPRRKLILVALAALAGTRMKGLRVNPMDLAISVGLDRQDGGEKVADHIRSLDGEYLDVSGVLDAAIPMMKIDLTRLAEFDDFGGIA